MAEQRTFERIRVRALNEDNTIWYAAEAFISGATNPWGILILNRPASEFADEAAVVQMAQDEADKYSPDYVPPEE